MENTYTWGLCDMWKCRSIKTDTKNGLFEDQ